MDDDVTLRQPDAQIVYLPAAEVKTCPELEGIFARDPATVERIRRSMAADGFHSDEPLAVAQDRDGNIIGVADGNTRLTVARELGISEVPVMRLTFESIGAAMTFARNRQLRRRNLTQAEIYKIATSLKPTGTKNGGGRATERAAEEYGVSPSTLEHARTVEKRADEETKSLLRSNALTINQAYQRVRRKNKRNEDGGG